MKNYNTGGSSKGKDFGSGKRFGGGQNSNRAHSGHGKFGGGKRNDFHGEGHNRREGSFGTPQLFAAVCSDCGKGCEVPFRPSAEKPVFCGACFGKKKHAGERDTRNTRIMPAFVEENVHTSIPKQVRLDNDEKYGALTKQLVTLESKVSMILELLSSHAHHPEAVAHQKTSEVTKATAVKREVKPKRVLKVVAKPKGVKKVASKVKTKK